MCNVYPVNAGLLSKIIPLSEHRGRGSAGGTASGCATPTPGGISPLRQVGPYADPKVLHGGGQGKRCHGAPLARWGHGQRSVGPSGDPGDAPAAGAGTWGCPALGDGSRRRGGSRKGFETEEMWGHAMGGSGNLHLPVSCRHRWDPAGIAI